MQKDRLYNVAKRYTEIIEQIERTRDPERLETLEEERIRWHDLLMRLLRRRGMKFLDREEVTWWAYRLIRSQRSLE